MKRFLVAAVVPAAILSSPVAAQDRTADDTMSGPWIAALGGYENVRISDGIDSGNEGGLVYGFAAGFDIDTSGLVIGLEGELTKSEVDVSAADVIDVGDEVRLSTGRDLYAGLRLGFKAGPNNLAYLKGGYTDARLKASYNDGAGTVLSGSDSVSGFRIGAGFEHLIGGGNFGVRGEYRYSDYGDYGYDGFDSGLSMTRHQLMVGLFGKF